MSDVRTVLVPEGLDGSRVDAAVARLFGLSRTKAAEVASGGGVRIDGSAVLKSATVRAGSQLEVALPSGPVATSSQVVAEPKPP